MRCRDHRRGAWWGYSERRGSCRWYHGHGVPRTLTRGSHESTVDVRNVRNKQDTCWGLTFRFNSRKGPANSLTYWSMANCTSSLEWAAMLVPCATSTWKSMLYPCPWRSKLFYANLTADDAAGRSLECRLPGETLSMYGAKTYDWP